MTLLHDYQNGTAYHRGGLPLKEPHWQRHVDLYKSYAKDESDAIALPRPEALPKADLWLTLRERRSHRRFTDQPIAQPDVALLLWAAQGITQPGAWAFRTAPSAGALYPVETYVAAARVEGLAPGVYHWELPGERLALLRKRDDVAAVARKACLGQGMAGAAPVTFVWSALWARSARSTATGPCGTPTWTPVTWPRTCTWPPRRSGWGRA